MSSKLSLLAIPLGLGLSLTACGVQEDGDLDLDVDSPDVQTMGGGDTLPPPPGTGSGGNGARPAPHCLKAMVQTMSYFAAGRGSSGFSYNTAIDWVRCNDVLWDPNDTVGNTYPKIPDVPGALEAMTWAGAHPSYVISQSTQQGTQYYFGPGWFAKNWAGGSWGNVMDPANRDLLGGVITSKWNWGQYVNILVQADGLDGPNTTETWDVGEYTLRESMVVFDPDAPAVTSPTTGPSSPSPGLHVFVADAFKASCPHWNDWFNRRLCHTGVACGISYLPESDVGTICKKGQSDGTVSPDAATGIDDAYRCLGTLRPVKVRVKPGDISNDLVCHPLT